jgi:hypothetical protein
MAARRKTSEVREAERQMGNWRGKNEGTHILDPLHSENNVANLKYDSQLLLTSTLRSSMPLAANKSPACSKNTVRR